MNRNCQHDSSLFIVIHDRRHRRHHHHHHHHHHHPFSITSMVYVLNPNAPKMDIDLLSILRFWHPAWTARQSWQTGPLFNTGFSIAATKLAEGFPFQSTYVETFPPPKKKIGFPQNLSALTLIHYIPICSHTTIIPHFTQRFRNQLAQRSHHQGRTRNFSFAKFQVPSSFLYETRCRYPMRALPRCKAANSEHQTRMLLTWNSEKPFD